MSKPSHKPATVSDALEAARRYWEANESTRGRGPNMMPIRAGRCAELLGRSRKVASLTAADGASLLVGLRSSGLSRTSVASYYAAGKRMLALSGHQCVGWPKAPSPARKVREGVSPEAIAELVDELEARGWSDTADLVRLMRDTGLRVEVEALRGDWSVQRTEGGGGKLVVHSGKGGHGRVIPYKGPHRGPGDLAPRGEREALRGLTYEGHLRRIKATGSSIRPHDLRRAFVKRVYEGSGKDIRVAQVLAGHADPGTTAGYIGVNFEEMERAVAWKP